MMIEMDIDDKKLITKEILLMNEEKLLSKKLIGAAPILKKANRKQYWKNCCWNWELIKDDLIKRNISEKIKQVKTVYLKKNFLRMFINVVNPNKIICWKIRNYICNVEIVNTKINRMLKRNALKIRNWFQGKKEKLKRRGFSNENIKEMDSSILNIGQDQSMERYNYSKFMN
jgi:hypothetical protein